MPTYEYECQKCGHQFEIVQSIKADALKKCPQPKCRGHVKRLLSTGAGLIFKGSGFYITDYRKPGYQEAAKKDSNTPAPTPTKDSTTVPAKPAAPAKKKD